MKIGQSLITGFSRAIKLWKGILLVWFCSFFTVSLLFIPFRGALRTSFVRSMITDSLREGFDFMVFTDLGPVLKSLTGSFLAGFLLILIITVVVNAFLTGGLFGTLRKDSANFSMQDFFSRASHNFWSFLFISVAITLMTIIIFVAVFAGTTVIAGVAGFVSEKNSFFSQSASFLFMMLLLPALLLVADNSRVCKASDESSSGLAALGSGLKMTFSRFWSAYAMMLILVVSQTAFGIAVIYLISAWKPVTGKEVFLLFVVSQVLVYIRFLLKTWRYGSVTAFHDR